MHLLFWSIKFSEICLYFWDWCLDYRMLDSGCIVVLVDCCSNYFSFSFVHFLLVCIFLNTYYSYSNRLLPRDLNTVCLRYPWLTFRMTRSTPTERLDWEPKMFKEGMFWLISGYDWFFYIFGMDTKMFKWFYFFCFLQ